MLKEDEVKKIDKDELFIRSSLFSTDSDKIKIIYDILSDNDLELLYSIYCNTSKERMITNSDLGVLILLKVLINKMDKIIEMVNGLTESMKLFAVLNTKNILEDKTKIPSNRKAGKVYENSKD